MKAKKVPQEHRDAIVEAYLGGLSLAKAAALFGYPQYVCSNEMVRRGIPRRGNIKTIRRYTVDSDFFATIDDEEKAYWLGFVTADGHVDGSGRVKLALNIRDKGHVLKFRAAIASNHPVYEWTQQNRETTSTFIAVRINKIRFAETLQTLGVTPRKSLTVKPCQQVPASLLRHYWRGFFDGDGCISRSKGRNNSSYQWRIGIVGNKAMIYAFDAWVKTFAKTAAKPYPGGKVFIAGYGGTRIAKAIVEQLYRDAHVYLDRKQELALKVMATPTKCQNRSGITQIELDTLHAEQGTWTATALSMGMSRVSLYQIRRRLARRGGNEP